MKTFIYLILALSITACTGRSEKNVFNITLKNDSSKDLSLQATIRAPSGDDSQCLNGESGKLTVNSKSESSLSLSIKCTIKNGSWLNGSIQTSPLLEDFLASHKIFSYDLPIKLLNMDVGKIQWSFSEKTLALGAEKTENYISNEYLYLPGVVKIFQSADFKDPVSWYYKASSHYRFFLITDKAVEKADLEVDKGIVTPYKPCDSCTLITMDGQLVGDQYKIAGNSIANMSISLNITEQKIQNLFVTCTDQECVLQ